MCTERDETCSEAIKSRKAELSSKNDTPLAPLISHEISGKKTNRMSFYCSDLFDCVFDIPQIDAKICPNLNLAGERRRPILG
jgi:hypothetical protein